jgi:putative pyrimidine permease RutG
MLPHLHYVECKIAHICKIMFILAAVFLLLYFRSLLLGTIIGYMIHAICGVKNVGPPIDFSEIVSSPWVRVPNMYYDIKFNVHSISMVMPILVVLLAENLGHMKAIGSITGSIQGRPIMEYIGRAYLGDALGCLAASLGGTIPFTTYAENIGVLVKIKSY